MTLKEKVIYYSEKFGIKKGYIARYAGMHQCTLSDWLNSDKEISGYYISQLERFVSKARAVEDFLKRNE